MPSNDDIALDLSHVSKRYTLARNRGWRASEVFFHPLTFLREFVGGDPFWALRDVNLTVPRGEFLSIIGPNGSGKSTLMRIMAGLSPASSGVVHANGRVAALLELGAGFHPMATGRENAYMNGLLMGLSKQQIKDRLPEIISFAELEAFADQPMRTYSMGMSLRLSFSVAVHVRPEILLVDEVLAVGDADFQEKCYAHFETLKRDRVTIVLVTHDLTSVERFADRVVIIQQGELVREGKPGTIVEEYLRMLAEKSPAIRRAVEQALRERFAKQKIEAELAAQSAQEQRA